MHGLRLIKRLIAKSNWEVEEQWYKDGKYGSNYKAPSELDKEALSFAKDKFVELKENLLREMKEDCPYLIVIDFELKMDAAYFYGMFSKELSEDEKQDFLNAVAYQYSDNFGLELEHLEYRNDEDGEISYNIVLFPDDFKIELI